MKNNLVRKLLRAKYSFSLTYQDDGVTVEIKDPDGCTVGICKALREEDAIVQLLFNCIESTARLKKGFMFNLK